MPSRPISLEGHLRRDHVDGMSTIAAIATELLRYGNGRNPTEENRARRRDFSRR